MSIVTIGTCLECFITCYIQCLGLRRYFVFSASQPRPFATSPARDTYSHAYHEPPIDRRKQLAPHNHAMKYSSCGLLALLVPPIYVLILCAYSPPPTRRAPPLPLLHSPALPPPCTYMLVPIPMFSTCLRLGKDDGEETERCLADDRFYLSPWPRSRVRSSLAARALHAVGTRPARPRLRRRTPLGASPGSCIYRSLTALRCQGENALCVRYDLARACGEGGGCGSGRGHGGHDERRRTAAGNDTRCTTDAMRASLLLALVLLEPCTVMPGAA
jgi:hypothetical protein